MPPYSNTQDVRELARSVLIAEFPDAEILEEQLYAQSKIWTVTKKTDWDVSDPQFEYIKKMEMKQAAIYVLEHYNVIDILPIIEAWKEEIAADIETVVGSISDEAAQDEPIKVVASNYESYPLSLEDDPQAVPHRSTDISV
jgi:hypothetical protein